MNNSGAVKSCVNYPELDAMIPNGDIPLITEDDDDESMMADGQSFNKNTKHAGHVDKLPNGKRLQLLSSDAAADKCEDNTGLTVTDSLLSIPEAEICSWGPLRPSFCQRFRSPKWVLFWLCCAGAIQGMVVNGFINVVISNIERRYDLSSTESGTIASCYDIASVLCLIPISYFGGRGTKPKYLGIGVLVMGLGSFLFSLPHFMTGIYHVKSTQENLCYLNSNMTSEFCDPDETPQSLSLYKYVFFLGQLLHGAGASPLYTIGVTYLDENLTLEESPVYIGIFYALAIVGPAFGYLAGGQFLNLYTDLGALDNDKLTPSSPKWVGAWWIGFLISGCLALLVALPLAGFPRQLPGTAEYMSQRESEAYHKEEVISQSATTAAAAATANTSSSEPRKTGFRDIFLSIGELLLNPTFMFLNLAASSEGLLLSGFATFTPKFIESQFSLPASSAAQYVGFAVIPAGGGGTFLGGYLVRRFKLRVPGIVKLCVASTILSLILILVFLVQCQNVPFAGVNIPYRTNAENFTISYINYDNLTDKCNNGCSCQREVYNPVCSREGITFFSPCYAGCTTVSKNGAREFTNCSCVTSPSAVSAETWDVKGGKCDSNCIFLAMFMPFFAMVMLLTFITSMPALQATLRCVPHHQRSFALGIQWIIARSIGSIPGPILFGKVIDMTCQLWQQKCDEEGSCYFYDNKNMGLYLMAISMVGKALSTLFFFLSLLLYKQPPTNPDDEKHSMLEKNMKNNQDIVPLTDMRNYKENGKNCAKNHGNNTDSCCGNCDNSNCNKCKNCGCHSDSNNKYYNKDNNKLVSKNKATESSNLVPQKMKTKLIYNDTKNNSNVSFHENGNSPSRH